MLVNCKAVQASMGGATGAGKIQVHGNRQNPEARNSRYISWECQRQVNDD